MNLKKLTLGLAIVATLASCAKKEEGVEVAKFNSLSLKIDGAEAATRALTNKHTSQQLKPTLSTATLNLFTSADAILSTVVLNSTQINEAISSTGTVVNVSGSSAKVSMTANAVEGTHVRDYQVDKSIEKLPLRSTKASITSLDGQGSAEITDLKPAVARLEIEGAITGTGYTSIEVEAIYINNFYKEFNLVTGTPSSLVFNANAALNEWVKNYASSKDGDKMTTSTGFDTSAATPNTGIPAGKVDAYNIFPSLATANDDTPHVILKLKLTTKKGKVKNDRILTIKKFTDGSDSPITEFEAGKVYTLNLSSLNDNFKENPGDPENPEDPSDDQPEADKIELTVKVTVTNWTETTIKPVL